MGLGLGVFGFLGPWVFGFSGLWVVGNRFEVCGSESWGSAFSVMACRCQRLLVLEFCTFKVCVVGVRFWGFVVFSVR